jgi:hypothetical protein
MVDAALDAPEDIREERSLLADEGTESGRMGVLTKLTSAAPWVLGCMCLTMLVIACVHAAAAARGDAPAATIYSDPQSGQQQQQPWHQAAAAGRVRQQQAPGRKLLQYEIRPTVSDRRPGMGMTLARTAQHSAHAQSHAALPHGSALC